MPLPCLGWLRPKEKRAEEENPRPQAWNMLKVLPTRMASAASRTPKLSKPNTKTQIRARLRLRESTNSTRRTTNPTKAFLAIHRPPPLVDGFLFFKRFLSKRTRPIATVCAVSLDRTRRRAYHLAILRSRLETGANVTVPVSCFSRRSKPNERNRTHGHNRHPRGVRSPT